MGSAMFKLIKLVVHAVGAWKLPTHPRVGTAAVHAIALEGVASNSTDHAYAIQVCSYHL